MNQPNNIDELFRQRLQQAEIPPPEFVWTNVERAIQPRKRRYFFWLFAAVLAGGALWALWPAQGTTGDAVQNPGLQDIEQAFPASEKPAASVSPQQQPEDSPNGISAVVNEAELSNNADPANAGNTGQTAKPSNTTEALNKQGATRQPALKTRQAEAKSVDFNNLKNFRNQPPPKTENREPESGQTTPETLSQPAEDFQQANPVAEHAPLTTMPLYFPAKLDAPARTSGPKRLEIPPMKKKAPKKCYDFHTNRQAWLLDAYAGPSFIRKRLDTGNPEYKSYAQDRLNSETHQWAINAGVRASYLFAENFVVRTGLHYDQFVEQFEYIDPNFIKYTVVITQQYVNGQWVSVPDTVDIQYGSNYVKTYNRFALLDIPLQAALELRSGPMGISLNLGGSVNVLFKKRGALLSIDDKPVDLEQYEVFRPKVGLSLLGSIQWFYHIRPRTRVFAEPYYRHILDPVTRAGYPVEQTYGISGIRFGLTQIFD